MSDDASLERCGVFQESFPLTSFQEAFHGPCDRAIGTLCQILPCSCHLEICASSLSSCRSACGATPSTTPIPYILII